MPAIRDPNDDLDTPLRPDAPEWSLDVNRNDGESKLYTDLTYHSMMALLLVPLGVAINHDTVMSADVYRAGVHRARLETFAPANKETKEPQHGA